MIFHIAVCSPDPVLRGRVERQCLEYYARRADACIVEQLPGVDALLARDAEGTRYELYLVELTAGNAPAGLKAADTLRRHGARAPLAFFAHTPAHAYNAYRVDAMQYLLLPFRPEQFTALLDRATEPEYGPVIAVSTAAGLRALPFADIEYLECTHHVVHFHLVTGEDVPSLSLRVPFAEVAKPLLADDRFLQPHRSYVVNLAAAEQLAAGEFRMRSGARVPIPRGKEAAADAFDLLAQDLEQNIKEGTSTLPFPEKYRVMFEGIPCWPKLPNLFKPLKENGVNVTAVVYAPAFGFVYNNMDEMARAYYKAPNSVCIEQGVAWREGICRDRGAAIWPRCSAASPRTSVCRAPASTATRPTRATSTKRSTPPACRALSKPWKPTRKTKEACKNEYRSYREGIFRRRREPQGPAQGL